MPHDLCIVEFSRKLGQMCGVRWKADYYDSVLAAVIYASKLEVGTVAVNLSNN